MSRLSYFAGACAAWLLLALAACATWEAPANVSDADMRGRAVTRVERDVRVSAAVMSQTDIQHMFGADLVAKGVQPVWIEVHNGTSQPLWLLRTGTDPDYFSPLEVAWALHAPFSGDTNARIDDHLDKLSFKNPIVAGGTQTGVLFTNPQHRTKLLNVDLLGSRMLVPFTLFLPVPEEVPDPALFQYPTAQFTNYRTLSELRAAIERLPCCASDARGLSQGDPLNVIFVGELADIGAAVVRRNYRRDARAGDREQLLFGRPPDAVLRKQAQAGAPSTWLRAWLAPISFEGRSVYVVQAGRPVGGRFVSRDTPDAILHDDVDEARNLLIQDMAYSGGLEKLGFATGVGEVSEAEPRITFRDARYHTDGLRAVLFFATRPLSLADIEFIQWVPYLERREHDNGDARQPGR